MGVTIHYRGSLKDLDRVVDFEDRVLDLALELGGQGRIWRSASKDNPGRMVRGVTVNLSPGQETTSLLVSPEGWLVNLFEIEDAENGKLTEPPYCFVKTQHGPVEGHVALVEMLTVLKREFLPDLEVSDEGEYWETRNLDTLVAKFEQIEAAMDGMAAGLEKFPLSREAAEDRDILVKRIERIAEVVHRTLARPAEHPPTVVSGEDVLDAGDAETEAQWDASFKENRRRQERVERAIEEHLARGEDSEHAFDAAMREETALGLPAEEGDESEESATFREWLAEIAAELEADADEPWKESLREPPSEDTDEDAAGADFNEPEFHSLQNRAGDLMMRLCKLSASANEAARGHVDALLQGAGDMAGGLAQALGDDDFPRSSGLAIVQLKRALRGAAYALGALFPLRDCGLLDQSTFDELHATIEELQTDIFAELSRRRERPADR